MHVGKLYEYNFIQIAFIYEVNFFVIFNLNITYTIPAITNKTIVSLNKYYVSYIVSRFVLFTSLLNFIVLNKVENFRHILIGLRMLTCHVYFWAFNFSITSGVQLNIVL